MKKSVKNLRVVLGHDLLTKLGGAERVLAEFAEIFPKSTIYTLVHDKKFTNSYFPKIAIRATFLQIFPRSLFRYFLPLMPLAVSGLKIPEDTDLVIIDSASFAKGIRVPKNIPYILYLHTPTRFLWKDKDWYLQKSGRVPKFLSWGVNLILARIRRWDYLTMSRPDIVIANSHNIAKQCLKYYDRKPDAVVFPPVAAEKFHQSKTTSDYFLLVARIEPYKNVELTIQAAIKSKIKLKIVGDGSQAQELRQKYQYQNSIEFIGKVSDQKLALLYSSARGLIFPQEEDAGIVPLEAFASGCPVIALKAGGALETVIPGKTGEFFDKADIDSLVKAIKNFDSKGYNKNELRQHALRFSSAKFREQIKSITEGLINS